MSLLPTEHLSIVLCPDQVGVVRRPVGMRRQPLSQVELLVLTDNTGWQQPLDALAYWLKTEEVKDVSASITVSNSWGRFALSPWSTIVGNETEEKALARACMESANGDMTGWTLELGPNRYEQSRIVCALETAFLDRLHSILREHKIVCRGVYPYFVLASMKGRAFLSGPASVLAVAESGTVVLASAHHGNLHSLRSVKNELTPETLVQILEREALLQGFTEAPALGAWLPGMAQAKIPKVALLNSGDNSSSSVRSMVYEAAASPVRMEVDFVPEVFSKGKIAGLVSFLIAFGIATWSGWSYLQLQQQATILQADWQRLNHNEARPHVINTAEEQERVKSEMRFASRVIEKLDTPWDDLFGAVENVFNDQVTLLSIEPDTERNEIRLIAESKDMKSMLDYVQQVRQSPILKKGYLVDHQINQQDPQRPVRFTVTANWAANLPAEAHRNEHVSSGSKKP